jgi:hypothetical protein
MVSKILLAALICMLGVGVMFGSYTVGLLNTEAVQSNEIQAKQLDNKNQYDNMWKQISQVAQVSEQDRASLGKIFNDYAQARSGTGGDNQAVMKWIKEAIPNVDNTTMVNLQNIITSTRNGFTRNQTELIDKVREHNTPFDLFPSGMVLSMFSRKKIDAKLVTSSRTEKAFDTGTDDDTSVFGKK